MITQHRSHQPEPVSFFFTIFARKSSVSAVWLASFDLISLLPVTRFYIRSQRDPTLCWHVNSNENVLVSRDDAPTPFVVELREPLGFPISTVLIGADDVVILVPSFSGKGKNVATADDNGLVLGDRRDVFKFGDLTDRIGRVNSGQQNLFRLFKNDQNRGKVWELV